MTGAALVHGLAWCCCAGTAFLAVACGIGVLVMRDPWQRLHFSAPPATLGAALLALAIALESGPRAALKPLLVVLLLTVQNGVVTHALARAVWIRRCGPFPPEER
ncbi:MAG TPA: monovalent cation/H(+) antiporter subunit G [Anaeromyxobacteraceae bacterium]|nr:monovalent cation/H(+) antiporter subunit G [Anaeromyxobacteraceae bacterium]